MKTLTEEQASETMTLPPPEHPGWDRLICAIRDTVDVPASPVQQGPDLEQAGDVLAFEERAPAYEVE